MVPGVIHVTIVRPTHLIAGPDGLQLDIKNSEGHVAGIVLGTPEDGNFVVDRDALSGILKRRCTKIVER